MYTHLKFTAILAISFHSILTFTGTVLPAFSIGEKILKFMKLNVFFFPLAAHPRFTLLTKNTAFAHYCVNIMEVTAVAHLL